MNKWLNLKCCPNILIKVSDWIVFKSTTAEPFFFSIGLTEIIAGTAITQSIKGIFTAGTVKTGRYAGAKLSKWWAAKK